jgi:hypothetical protein
MTKEKNFDGSITWIKEGRRYTVSAERIARCGGEAGVDKSMGYVPSAYSHPAEYAHLYQGDTHDEE